MAGVLLHTPMVRSREHARAGEQRAWIDAVTALFGVDVEAAAGVTVRAAAGADAAAGVADAAESAGSAGG